MNNQELSRNGVSPSYQKLEDCGQTTRSRDTRTRHFQTRNERIETGVVVRSHEGRKVSVVSNFFRTVFSNFFFRNCFSFNFFKLFAIFPFFFLSLKKKLFSNLLIFSIVRFFNGFPFFHFIIFPSFFHFSFVFIFLLFSNLFFKLFF